ncbi:MAG: ligase-associated DNA damage response endonuclease PdeM [Rhizobiaceae bacterium]|nr:ligase-associated DNA damage response endonuclease PdeM [Rhizobiaceae bacterium]MCV0405846.1 ligase-associated DNA damage response endonuclease PdeM [Rhizobiaceae bacterium]
MLARTEDTRRTSITARLAGREVILDMVGALVDPEASMLVVSDLHLEKGSSYARRGSMLPPYDTMATLARLGALLARHDPAIVISLGDSFHDGEGAARLAEPARAALAAMMAGRQWLWVAGNHDPEPPSGLGGDCVAEVAVGGLRFRHEPSKDGRDGEVAGHLHPGARIVRRGRAVRRACFASDGRRLIMPAFGAYTGMLNVMDRAYRGLFDWPEFRAHLLGRERIYTIAGAQLRPG